MRVIWSMRRVLVAVALSSLFLAANVAVASAQASTRFPVLVPVIFEGVRYEAADFNALRDARFPSASLHYAWLGRDEVVHVFTSIEESRRFIRINSPRSASRSAAKAGLAAPQTDHGPCHNSYWSEF